MSAVEAPLGHRSVIEGLWRARQLGRLPHALLFEGPAGIGKFHAARWFIQGLFCERSGDDNWQEPCATCGACKRIAAGSHPDLFVLDTAAEGEESLLIERIAAREGGGASACDFFALRPMEGGMRVLLIREFERANVPAQNALLKTLEEPGESALLVLESSRSDLLLETVRSRCVTVRFAALSTDDAAEVLRQEGAGGPDMLQLVRWAGGSPGKALALQREGASAVRQVIADVLAGECDPLDAGQRILELPGEFVAKTLAAETRHRTRAALELLVAVLRDGLRRNSGVSVDRLAHGDVSQRAEGRELLWRAALEEVLALRGEVELNLSPIGVLDRAFLALPRAD